MITVGLSVMWAILFWYLHPKLVPIFTYLHNRDAQRLQYLQSRLHSNFVFQEKKTMQQKAYIFLGIGIFISFCFRSSSLFILVLLGFFAFPAIWIRSVEIIRAKKFQKQLLMFVPSLSSLLKSGHGLERALHQLKTSSKPPMSDEIGYLLKEVHLGSTLEEAFYRLAGRFQSENMMMLVHAISISRKLGTSLSEVIDNISKNILEKEKLRQQIGSLTAQGKMQAWVAVAMPFLIGIAMQFISPNYFQPLVETTPGHFCLAYCGISMTLGLVWIYKITHQEYL